MSDKKMCCHRLQIALEFFLSLQIALRQEMFSAKRAITIRGTRAAKNRKWSSGKSSKKINHKIMARMCRPGIHFAGEAGSVQFFQTFQPVAAESYWGDWLKNHPEQPQLEEKVGENLPREYIFPDETLK